MPERDSKHIMQSGTWRQMTHLTSSEQNLACPLEQLTLHIMSSALFFKNASKERGEQDLKFQNGNCTPAFFIAQRAWQLKRDRDRRQFSSWYAGRFWESTDRKHTRMAISRRRNTARRTSPPPVANRGGGGCSGCSCCSWETSPVCQGKEPKLQWDGGVSARIVR